MRNENKRLFEGFESPMLPTDLRDLTVREAGSALLRPPLPDCWGRLWESAWLRLVWAGGVAVLLVSHVVISTADDPVSPNFSRAGVLVAADYGDELSEIVDLPRIIDLRPSLMGYRNASALLGKRKSKGDVS